MTNWRGVPSADSEAQTLAVLQTIADENGEVRNVAYQVAELTDRTNQAIRNDMGRLAVRGEIMRIGNGHYRLPNAIAHRPERDEYPTAKACGIEPVIRMVADRNYCGNGMVTRVAVTLARVPCLEKALPE